MGIDLYFDQLSLLSNTKERLLIIMQLQSSWHYVWCSQNKINDTYENKKLINQLKHPIVDILKDRSHANIRQLEEIYYIEILFCETWNFSRFQRSVLKP